VNPRSAQILTASLAALLVILVGATIFIVLTRPTIGPTPEPSRTPAATLLPPSPTTVAVASPFASSAASIMATAAPLSTPALTAAPSPIPFPTLALPSSASSSYAPSPTATVTPTPTPTPTATPTTAPTVTAVPTATLTPTLPPTILPTSPQQQFQVDAVGLDDKSLVGSVPRILTFEIDGPSLLTATVSQATGNVQLCVWREAVDDERTCDTGRAVSIVHPVSDSDNTLWHASMIGAKGVAPSAALTIDFNANAPSVSLDDFRFYGSSNPPYNGFVAGFEAGGGQMSVQGAFDDGQGGAYNYHLVVQPDGADAVVDVTDNGTSFSVQPGIDAGHYTVFINDPEDVANPGLAVFVTATISWP
jgi:hypothetical protein